MSSISNLKGGQFCYIEHIENVVQSFGRCLTGLLSTVAQNIKINISEFEDVEASKIIASDYLLNKTSFNKIIYNTINLSSL